MHVEKRHVYRWAFNAGARTINILVQFFGIRFIEAELVVGSGNQEITVALPGKPLRVWISFDQNSTIPVCQGNIDKAGLTLLNDSFVLYTEIYSEMRSINWLAIVDVVNR